MTNRLNQAVGWGGREGEKRNGPREPKEPLIAMAGLYRKEKLWGGKGSPWTGEV